MSLEVKECTMVCPESETPRHSLRLSRLDMSIRMPYSHTCYIYVYHHVNIEVNNHPVNFFDMSVVKGALSRVLVSFYPLAGRLREKEENGDFEIDCNAHGVLFVEAEAPHALTDLGDGFDLIKPNSELRELIVPTWDYSKGLSSIPLLMVQFTRFKCGGVCMGVARHHHLSDATSYTNFIDSWSRVARGLDLLVLPIHERSCIPQLDRREPPQVKFQHLEYEPPLPPLPRPSVTSGDEAATLEGFFSLSKSQINALKLFVATSTSKEADHGYRLTTYEVVAGHVWRCVSKARGLADEQRVKLYIPVNARSRFKDPTPPKGYFGNLVFFAACIAKVEDITCKPWCAAVKIHEALEKMKDENYLKSALDYLESQPKPMVVLRGLDSVTSPNLLINSWVRIPFYEADFGWGRPKVFGRGGVRNEGLAFLVPTSIDDHGFTLCIKLFKGHMPLFEKYFYDFTNFTDII